MPTLSLHEIRDTPLEHIICHALAYQETAKNACPLGEPLTVVLTLNGVEIEALWFYNKMVEFYEDHVIEAANTLLASRITDKVDELTEILYEMRRKVEGSSLLNHCPQGN